MDKLSESFVRENLKLLNCKYIISNSIDVTAFLKTLSTLRPVEVIGTLTVFEVIDMESAWAYNTATGIKGEWKRISPSNYMIRAVGNAGDIIHVSLAYHSNWKAFYANEEIPIQYHKALMKFELPAEGDQTIELRYNTEKMIPILLFIFGVAIFMAILLYANRLRRG
jgi:hypothetical protein